MEKKDDFELFLDESKSNLADLVRNTDDLFEQKLIEHGDLTKRKKFGQFPTPIKIARLMVKLGLFNNVIHKFLDPAIGCGILTKTFIRDVLLQPEIKEQPQIWGYDIDPLMIKAASIALNGFSSDFHFHTEDFLLHLPNEQFDFILANPPYVKSNQIPQKDRYLANLQKEFGIKFDGTTGLDGIFLLNCIKLLSETGKLVFITPGEFLNSGYGEKVKKILLKYLEIEYLIYFESSDKPDFAFQDGMSSALITVARKKRDAEHSTTIRFIRLYNWENGTQLFQEIIKGQLTPPNSMRLMTSTELNPKSKWAPIFNPNDEFQEFFKHFVPLSTYFSCNRGIATGSNTYFTLSSEDKKQWKIDPKYLRPILAKAVYAKPPVFTEEDFQQLVQDGKKCYLLFITEENPDNLQDYLAFGVKNQVNDRFLTRSRKRWFFMEQRKPADVIVKVFNRGPIQFILNATQCLNLTCFHGIYTKDPTRPLVKPLLLFLNSPYGVESIRLELRPYGGGLKKLEPRDVEKILIPDFRHLSNTEIARLNHLFDQWVSGELKNQKSINDEIFSLISSLNSRISLNNPKHKIKSILDYVK